MLDTFSGSLQSMPLPNGEQEDMSAVSFFVSELGTFLDPKNTEMIDVLVDMWDCKDGNPFERRTKGDGLKQISNPWISILGCTTPSWIQTNLPDYFIGGGFASRSIFLHASEKRQLIAWPGRHMNAQHNVLRETLLHDLNEIALIFGAYQPSDAFYDAGEAWYTSHHGAEQVIEEKFAGYRDRKQAHICKLAMVLAASESDRLILDERFFHAAYDQINAAEEDLQEVFKLGRFNPIMRYVPDILSHLRREPGNAIQKENLYRRFMGSMNSDQFNMLLNSTQFAGYTGTFTNGLNQTMIELKNPDSRPQLKVVNDE